MKNNDDRGNNRLYTFCAPRQPIGADGIVPRVVRLLGCCAAACLRRIRNGLIELPNREEMSRFVTTERDFSVTSSDTPTAQE
jgi:hypothetical protein